MCTNALTQVTREGVKLVVSFESQWGTAGILTKCPGENMYIINIGKIKYQVKFRIVYTFCCERKSLKTDLEVEALIALEGTYVFMGFCGGGKVAGTPEEKRYIVFFF